MIETKFEDRNEDGLHVERRDMQRMQKIFVIFGKKLFWAHGPATRVAKFVKGDPDTCLQNRNIVTRWYQVVTI